MSPILLEGPAVEPVGTPEMRAFLRLDDGTEDALVAALIAAARRRVEALSGRVLLGSRWRMELDRWPAGGVLALSPSPVLAVEAVRVAAAGGASVLLAPATYRLVPGDPPRLLVDPARPEPTVPIGGIAVDLRAGYGELAADVPAPLVQAVRLLAARSFEHRGDDDQPAIPPEVLSLVAPFRRARL